MAGPACITLAHEQTTILRYIFIAFYGETPVDSLYC